MPGIIENRLWNVMNQLSSVFLLFLSVGLNPTPSAKQIEQNWCGTAEKMMWLKYRVGDMVEAPDSSLIFTLRPSQSRKAKIVEIHDQAICEKATRVYYRRQLGPYPADGVAVVRFGDRYGVLGDIHAGEWAILEVYNLNFEAIEAFGS